MISYYAIAQKEYFQATISRSFILKNEMDITSPANSIFDTKAQKIFMIRSIIRFGDFKTVVFVAWTSTAILPGQPVLTRI